MRIAILIIVFTIIGYFRLDAQELSLAMMNSETPCSGFTNNSDVYLKITSDHPFRIPDNAGVVYDWYADHENGLKKWNTRLNSRTVPLPWPGVYNFYVVSRYVNKETLSPFASFKSGVITIKVESCPESRYQSNNRINSVDSRNKN